PVTTTSPATTRIYPLSLHDALPISVRVRAATRKEPRLCFNPGFRAWHGFPRTSCAGKFRAHDDRRSGGSQKFSAMRSPWYRHVSSFCNIRGALPALHPKGLCPYLVAGLPSRLSKAPCLAERQVVGYRKT